MRITGGESEEKILKELGQRIKQYRISMNIKQEELAARCGISASTATRIENGNDVKMSNYIKILSALNLADNIDMLIPEPQLDFKSLFEEKPTKQRVKSSAKKPNSKWVWGEDE